MLPAALLSRTFRQYYRLPGTLVALEWNWPVLRPACTVELLEIATGRRVRTGTLDAAGRTALDLHGVAAGVCLARVLAAWPAALGTRPTSTRVGMPIWPAGAWPATWPHPPPAPCPQPFFTQYVHGTGNQTAAVELYNPMASTPCACKPARGDTLAGWW